MEEGRATPGLVDTQMQQSAHIQFKLPSSWSSSELARIAFEIGKLKQES